MTRSPGSASSRPARASTARATCSSACACRRPGRSCRRFRGLALDEVDALLGRSGARVSVGCGVLLLVAQYPRATWRPSPTRYLAAVRRGRVNNWDLVDATRRVHPRPVAARPAIAQLLDELAASASLWERRVGRADIVRLHQAGRRRRTTLRLAERLLSDRRTSSRRPSDGCCAGRQARRCALLRDFLDQHAGAMPRTMLSYATEHSPPRSGPIPGVPRRATVARARSAVSRAALRLAMRRSLHAACTQPAVASRERSRRSSADRRRRGTRGRGRRRPARDRSGHRPCARRGGSTRPRRDPRTPSTPG